MIIRSISGVRGTAPEFNSETIKKYACAFHSMQPKGVFILGRDTRPSGEMYLEKFALALNSVGRDVINLNIVPTPTVQFMVEITDAAGGVIITASHNPIEWNGLKFVRSDGTFLHLGDCEELFRIVDSDISIAENESGLHYPDVNAIQKHLIRVVGLSCIDQKRIRNRHYKVVVDAVNGAASDALPAMLEALGCDVVKLYCEGDGVFARKPEPLPENLTDLSQAVVENNADIGFASDPDGDRLAVVMEDGHTAGDEYTLVFAADGYLQTTGQSESLVTNLSTTMALDKLAEKYHSTVERSAVGEINVVQKMVELNADFGGEGNGGVILKEAHLGRDSLVAAAMVLHRMTLTDEPISTIFYSLPQFRIVKDKVEIKGIDKNVVFEKAKSVFSNAEINDVDGVKFSWEDRWIHLRTSNTEPIMRIYAEGRTKEDAQLLVDKVKGILN
ncbi:MAG: phosphoglucosamine mutase [Fidelibacterota bacterium]